MYRHATAIRKATEKMIKRFSKRHVKAALNSRNGPDTPDICTVSIGSDLLVFRTRSKKWERPFTLLGLEEEKCTALLPHGPSKFPSTAIKRCTEDYPAGLPIITAHLCMIADNLSETVL